MKKIERDSLKLKDIYRSIIIIEKYVDGLQFSDFKNNEMMQSASIRHFEIIGEAAVSLSQTFINQTKDIPWQQIRAFRNILAHEYFRIDVAEVWATIKNDLPILKEKIEPFL